MIRKSVLVSILSLIALGCVYWGIDQGSTTDNTIGRGRSTPDKLRARTSAPPSEKKDGESREIYQVFLESNIVEASVLFSELALVDQYAAMEQLVIKDPHFALEIANSQRGLDKRKWILKVVEKTLELKGVSDTVALLEEIGNGTARSTVALWVGQALDASQSEATEDALNLLIPEDRMVLLQGLDLDKIGAYSEFSKTPWFSGLSEAEKMPLLLKAGYLAGRDGIDEQITSLLDETGGFEKEDVQKLRKSYISGMIATSPVEALGLVSSKEWGDIFLSEIHPIVSAMASQDPVMALREVKNLNSEQFKHEGIRVLFTDLINNDAETAAKIALDNLEGEEQKVAISAMISYLKTNGYQEDAKEWEGLLK